ncbi:hypothetical protein VPNG_03163 [Cytospora leucostoma]|uniref:Tat pathway signal sequence n=1 Tax=Cytospora leucostoma TaxID=1230097 RepID=A0A423XEM6_9PEZI|nr:hypothetical protein VPNG_03163 [Cytospora leucostoma]
MKPMHIDTDDREASVPFLDEEHAVLAHHDGGSSSRIDKGWPIVQQKWHTRKSFWLTYINITLFLISVIILVRSSRNSLCSPRPPTAQEALQRTSSWSPIFDWVDLTPESTTIDGRLHVPSNASIYRDEPSPQTDMAWDDLAAAAGEVILVDSSTLKRAGYNPDHYFKATEEWKELSPQAASSREALYPVQIDVFHQIHCLDQVRKQMHYQYYYADQYGAQGPGEMHWMHVRHCLHMVLQSLMCSADVDIVPHRWVEKDDKPFAQFSITKQCRNFDNLRQWNRENAVEGARGVWPQNKASMPKDAFVWPGYGDVMPE